MKFIIGHKLKMTSQYRPDGRVEAATVIAVEPCVVTQVRTKERDGYEAVQVGCGQRRRLTKPLAGHLKERGALKHLKEFRPKTGEALEALEVGATIDVSQFEVGDKVSVTGTSKGRGFQGVVKRHGFHGSPKTHGHKDQERMPGSIGATDAARVFKGTRMAGRMGAEQVTVHNLEILAVDAKRGELVVSGAVPGAPKSLVTVRA